MSRETWKLREPTPADAERISAFAAQVFPLGGRPGASEADIAAHVSRELSPQKMRATIADPNFVSVIAENGDEVAGYILLKQHSEHEAIAARHPAEVKRLYVAPAYHGRGVANALMEAALQRMDPQCDALWLSVFSENPRGIAFYKRWGFTIAAEQIFMVGDDPQKDYVMRREMKGQ